MLWYYLVVRSTEKYSSSRIPPTTMLGGTYLFFFSFPTNPISWTLQITKCAVQRKHHPKSGTLPVGRDLILARVARPPFHNDEVESSWDCRVFLEDGSFPPPHKCRWVISASLYGLVGILAELTNRLHCCQVPHPLDPIQESAAHTRSCISLQH